MASFLVLASLKALELFQTEVAFQTKVFALDLRGRGVIPAVAALEPLVSSPEGIVGKMRLPRGFLDPSGPSELWKAFHVSIATARTVTALYDGMFACSRRSLIFTWSRLHPPDSPSRGKKNLSSGTSEDGRPETYYRCRSLQMCAGK